MTSKHLRRRSFQGRKFPGQKFKRKISRLKLFEDLGNFYIDKVTVVIPEYWEVMDWPGTDHGAKPQYAKAEKKKLLGYLHQRTYEGFEYQIFQSLGQNRNLQFNPRHFANFGHFEEFFESILRGKRYHISRIDFSWLLSKDYVSVSFLLWCLWRKGLTLDEGSIRKYEDPHIKILNPDSIQEFCIGKSHFIISCYDCDAHNTDKCRPPSKQVHSCVNMEVQIRTKGLKRIGIRNLQDLEVIDLKKVLKDISFLTPSLNHFKNTDYEYLYKVWEIAGAGTMMQALYEDTKTKSYLKIKETGLQPLALKAGESTFENYLLQLAKCDWDAYLNQGGVKKRLTLRALGYDMRPLFDDAQKKVINLIEVRKNVI